MMRAWYVLLLLVLLVWGGAVEAASLQLQWQNTSINELGFRIERKIGQLGQYVQIVQLGKNQISYVDALVIENTDYCYRVKAYNDVGESPYSNEACGKTLPQSTKLVAHWSFDDGGGSSASDFSGNNHVGVLVNNPLWTNGKKSGALQFIATDDGNDDNDSRVVINQTLDVVVPFTFAVWVNPNSYADWRVILSKRDSSDESNMRVDIGLSYGTGKVYLYTGRMYNFLYAPPLNMWTHLTIVATAVDTKLYVNGDLQEVVGAIALGQKSTAMVVLGGTGEPIGGDNDPFYGVLDDVRIYNGVLTESEIYNLQ